MSASDGYSGLLNKRRQATAAAAQAQVTAQVNFENSYAGSRAAANFTPPTRAPIATPGVPQNLDSYALPQQDGLAMDQAQAGQRILKRRANPQVAFTQMYGNILARRYATQDESSLLAPTQSGGTLLGG